MKHAEKVMVGHAIGAHIPDDPSEDFDLDFNLTGNDITSGGAPIPPTPPKPVSRPKLPVPTDAAGREAEPTTSEPLDWSTFHTEKPF